MALAVETIEGPAFLAPALVNGDINYLSYGEQCLHDLFLSTIPSGWYVVATDGDEYVGKWRGGHCVMCSYVLHRMM